MRIPPSAGALQLVWTNLSIPYLFTLLSQGGDQSWPNASLRKWVNPWRVCPCPSNCSLGISNAGDKSMEGWMFSR